MLPLARERKSGYISNARAELLACYALHFSNATRSLNRRKDGTFRIIITQKEKQKNIQLGKIPKKTAELCLSMVERITAAQAAGVPLDTETATWTAKSVMTFTANS